MAQVTLPPPGRWALWGTFLKWVLGVPVIVFGAVGIIALALYLTGSGGMMQRTESDMGTVILMLGGIVLLYPAMLFVWTADLRRGLRTRREWDMMTPAEQEAAIAAARPAPRQRRSRKKAGTA
jgi:hypothetical protein